jgi:hypothetical protein
MAAPAVQVTVAAEGEGRTAGWRPEISGALTGEGTATAKTIQAYFLRTLAAAAGGVVHLSAQSSIVRATFQIS